MCETSFQCEHYSVEKCFPSCGKGPQRQVAGGAVFTERRRGCLRFHSCLALAAIPASSQHLQQKLTWAPST